jgi:hypothetical protein
MFMEKEIYKGKAWLVETTDGTEVIPDDVVTMPDFVGESDEEQSEALKILQPYCEGGIIEVPDCAVGGYLARMSAPGYLDCTPWSLYETEHEAETELDRLYGEED